MSGERKYWYQSSDGKLTATLVCLGERWTVLTIVLAVHPPVQETIGSWAYAQRIAREKVRGYDKGNPAAAAGAVQ